MANKEDKYSEQKQSGWQAFCKFVWNSETGQFLGRTGGSWCKYQSKIFSPPFPELFSFETCFFYQLNSIEFYPLFNIFFLNLIDDYKIDLGLLLN